MQKSAKITPKQNRAIRTLLTNSSIEAAATAAGVHRNTVARWMKQDAFKQALQNAEIEALSALTRRLAAFSDEAVSVLVSILQDSTVPPSVRLRAATEILSHLPKIREHFSIEERLAELEQRYND